MVCIRLFGHLEIHCGEKPVPIKSQPLSELLCYLLLYRGRERSREVLASELWGERSTRQSLKSLRQTLWQLTKLLDGMPGLTFHNRDYPQLELQPDAELDIALLEQTATLLDKEELTPEESAKLQKAASVYRGDLLEAWHYEWCLIERERYRNLYLALLDKLAVQAIAKRELQAGLQYAHETLRLEPSRECSHRLLMKLHLLRGERTAALRQFKRCAERLKDEYGVEPSQATLKLYTQAHGDQLPDKAYKIEASVTGDLKSLLQQILSMLHDIKQSLKT